MSITNVNKRAASRRSKVHRTHPSRLQDSPSADSADRAQSRNTFYLSPVANHVQVHTTVVDKPVMFQTYHFLTDIRYAKKWTTL